MLIDIGICTKMPKDATSQVCGPLGCGGAPKDAKPKPARFNVQAMRDALGVASPVEVTGSRHAADGLVEAAEGRRGEGGSNLQGFLLGTVSQASKIFAPVSTRGGQHG